MKILIIGAGINGILTAYFLANNRHNVEIIDEGSQPATRTTFANGCQLSFSHTTPMRISPSIFQTPCNRPLFLTKSEKLWLKSHNFFGNSFNERFHELTKLAIESKNAFDEIFTQFHDIPETLGHSSGTMYIFSEKSQFEARQKLFDIQKMQYGIDFIPLSLHDAVEYDGSLANVSHSVKHAIFTPFDRTLNAFEFTKFMAEKFKNLGGKIHYNAKIHEIVTKNHQALELKTSIGVFSDYDAFIYCGGASGLHLIGDSTPKLQPITGYSMTFDVSYSNHCPEINIIDFTNKMVYSRHQNSLRVAGFFDINDKNKEKRLQHFHKKALETFPVLEVQPVVHTWCENRVFTPNEIPFVGKIAENFLVNTGQGHLGITLSAGSAKKIAQIIQES
jgi:D-amino-acid dehydrogenase